MSECERCRNLGVFSFEECPHGSITLSPSDVEQLLAITDPGQAPCDCDTCCCGNYDDAAYMGAWRERKQINDQVLALIEGKQA